MYLWYGVAGATRSSYDAAVDSFLRFRRERGLGGAAFPARAGDVEAWVASEARRIAGGGHGLGKKALKRKVGSLVSWHTDLGMPTDGLVGARLERVIAGANRYHGVSTRAQPLPITLPVLRRIVSVIRKSPSAYGGVRDSLAVVAAFLTMFACFLRMGEVVYDTFDGRFDLTRGAVAFSEDGTKLTLPASKTDPFRAGVTLAVPRGPIDVCPVTALRLWMEASGGDEGGPLFTWKGGPFRRGTLEGLLRKALLDGGYAGGKFTGHSFRRGAATWAASIGMSATDIQTLGRWNSDCYRLYIDAGPKKTSAVGAAMLYATSTQSSLPPNGVPSPGDVWRPSI